MPALEDRKRSFVKSVTYRTLSICVDLVVAYYFTREVLFTMGIVAFVNGYSTFLYYAHERVWGHIQWGHTPILAEDGTLPEKTLSV